MLKNNISKILLILILPFSIIAISLISNSSSRRETFTLIKRFSHPSLKKFIKTNFLIAEENKRLSMELEKSTRKLRILKKLVPNLAIDNDLQIIKSGSKINFIKSENNKVIGGEIPLEIYQPNGKQSLMGIFNLVPGSAYLDSNENDIFLLSASGILGYSKKKNESLTFNQIKTNINRFIGEDQFRKKTWFSIKDLLIYQDKIYASYTQEVKENCWNTSIIYGNLNYEEIIFSKFFSPSECVHSKDNPDKVFNAHQSGGRIFPFDKNNLLLSTGEFRSRYLAQEKNSVLGKILKINIIDKNYKLISMGHRNIQGLYVDNSNKLLISTEHGPSGGDEINLLNLKINQKVEIPNYGWAISSYGDHYGYGKSTKKAKKELGYIKENVKNAYDLYPLYKSHKKYGFIEPLKYFVPSIGISEIVALDEEKKIYIFSSLKGSSLYLLTLDESNNIDFLSQIEVGERIRDIMVHEDQLVIYLENTGSLGFIKINNIFSEFSL